VSKHNVCPWRIGYLLASPIRKLAQDPARILEPYVHPGMTVLEPGPEMGFFTLELARMVGSQGRVVAVDVQPKMIAGLRRRAERAGLLDRIDARVVPDSTMALYAVEAAVDFVLAFAVVHELPSAATFFAEAARAMKPQASLLLAEPAGHVSDEEFGREIALAEEAGLAAAGRPEISRSRAAILTKPWPSAPTAEIAQTPAHP